VLFDNVVPARSIIFGQGIIRKLDTSSENRGTILGQHVATCACVAVTDWADSNGAQF
jgi:hypothetical protein